MKLNVGDIFEFSINEISYSYGQIVSIPNKESITIIIFEGLFKEKLLPDEIIQNEILFIGNTFDAKFYHKHWVVIGNTLSNIGSIKFPYYKIGTEPIFIEDYLGNKLREAKAKEINKLIYRPYVAPVRFELAMKAHYKSLDWKDEYNDLLYKNTLETTQFIEDSV